MKKESPYVMRQTSPVITVAKQVKPCCIITFNLTGTVIAFSSSGDFDITSQQKVVAAAWRFAQINTQPRETTKTRRAFKRTNKSMV